MYMLKRGVSLLVAVLLLMSCASALLLLQTPVLAWDSGDSIRSSSDLRSAVAKLPGSPKSNPTTDEVNLVDHIAAQLSQMSDTGKRDARESDLKKLAKFYNAYHGINNTGKDDIDLTGDSREVKSKRIDEGGSHVYGYNAVNGRTTADAMEIEQYKSSGSVKLRMDLNGFDGPVYVDLSFEGSPFSTSKDYYLKRDSSSKKLDVSVSKSRIHFVAPEEGEYKLYEDGKKDDDDDDDDDDDYYRSSSSSSTGLDSFWKSAVNNIKSASTGDRVRVSLGTRTTVPTEVLRTLKGKDATLALYESTGNIISIYGKDVTVPSGSTVSVATLRATYDKDAVAGSSSTAASSPPTGGLSALPSGIGSTTVAGGTATPNAGGAPTSAFPAGPVSALPRNYGTPPAVSPSSASSDSSSSEESSSEESSSEASSEGSSSALSLPTDYRKESGPEAENVAFQEPVNLPQPQDTAVGAPRIQRVVGRVGTAGILAFMGMAGLTAALGGGLLTYAILSRKDD